MAELFWQKQIRSLQIWHKLSKTWLKTNNNNALQTEWEFLLLMLELLSHRITEIYLVVVVKVSMIMFQLSETKFQTLKIINWSH